MNDTGTGAARWRSYAEQTFGIDLRGLAVYRISLGVLMLIDILDRGRDLVAHYTDAGVLPRDMAATVPGRLSLHMVSGGATWQGLLFAIHAVCALALILGVRTRWTLPALWFLLISLHTRNPLVLYGGDIELRMIVFWTLFLPVSALWSWDARSDRPPGDRVFGMNSAAYVLQIASIYVVTALLKSGLDWKNGTAVYYALQIDHFTSPFGKWLLNFPEVLSILTPATWWFELLGPVLLLVPNPWVRAGTVLGFMGMHVGFEACMEIGLFPEICVVAWIPLLPSAFWDRLRLPRLPSGTLRPSATASLIALIFTLYGVWWNLGSVGGKRFAVTGEWRTPAQLLRLDQYWDMFAPQPLKDDGWFVIVGERADGTETDVLHGDAVSWDKPALIATYYPNERWRKYMRNLWNKKYKEMRTPYLRWQCERWNDEAAAGAELVSVSMYYMKEQSTPPGHDPSPIEKVFLRKHLCKQPPKGEAPTPDVEPKEAAPKEAAPEADPN